MQSWHRLSSREQIIVLVSGFLLMIFLLWRLLWLPLQLENKQLKKGIKNSQEQLAWIQNASTEVIQLRGLKPATRQNRSVMSIAGNVLARQNLRKSLKQMKPKGDKVVRISLKGASFDATMKFLGELESRHQIHCSKFSLTPDKEVGRINLNMTLER